MECLPRVSRYPEKEHLAKASSSEEAKDQHGDLKSLEQSPTARGHKGARVFDECCDINIYIYIYVCVCVSCWQFSRLLL